MIEIVAHCNRNAINIKQTRLNRDWMDETWQKHAYRCFPVQLGNTIGYELSLPVDLSFKWNGIFNENQNNVELLKGRKYAYTGRGHATVSIKTGIIFQTPKNISMLQIPVPNMFRDDFQAFTTVMSTSWYWQELPSAIRILKPEQEITIKAGEPYAVIVPVSLGMMQDTELKLIDMEFWETDPEYNRLRNEAFEEIRKQNKWTDWYRNATDHRDVTLGEHEVKNLKLTINDERKNKRGNSKD